jgi:hypothetical protein
VGCDEVLAEGAWLEGGCGRGELGAPGWVVGGAVYESGLEEWFPEGYEVGRHVNLHP